MASSRIVFVCLLLMGRMFGQTAAPTPQLKARPAESASSAMSNLPPDTPVITVQGMCEKPAGSSATPSDCKTVITRAEFEKVVNTVQPNMRKEALKTFADSYVKALMLAEKAHEQGLDQTPQYQEMVSLTRLKILDQLALEQIQRQAAQVSDSEIEDFYRQHRPDFKTISYDRLYVPKQKQLDASPNDPELAKKRQASEPEMKEEADKLRARAAAGEDFNKLQQDAYDFAGFKMKAQNTHMNLPKTSAAIEPAVSELKKGEVSQVLSSGQGFTIYKIDDIQDRQLADVRAEIAQKLTKQKMTAVTDQLQESVSKSTTFDASYFAAPATPAPTLRNPGEVPSAPNAPNPSSTPAPGKK